jgi:serine/threonine protein kinase
MEEVRKLLEAEGYVLTSAEVDRGTHSVVYRCKRLSSSRHAAPTAFAARRDEIDSNDEDEDEEKNEIEIESEEEDAEEEGEAVRVKVLNESLPLPRHLTNFQHEHKIVEALMAAGVQGIVRVRGRLSRPSLEALVLEDFGGRSLDQWLARDGPMAGDMDSFLTLALAVARTLGHVHSHSVVHRDIKVHLPMTCIVRGVCVCVCVCVISHSRAHTRNCSRTTSSGTSGRAW